MTRFQIIFISAVAAIGITVSLRIRHLARSDVHQNEALLQQQNHRLAELATQHRRLTNLVAQAKRVSTEDLSAELLKLRAEAKMLRKEAHAPGWQPAEEPSWQPLRSESSTATNSSASVISNVVSDSDSEEYKLQLYRMASASSHSPPLTDGRTTADARNLRSALSKYAGEHQGEIPATFDQAAAYYYKDQPLPRTDEFEIVYQGSLNELTNVPLQAVSLIRERQAWPTPRGKWARVYVMISGDVKVVESDDNFQSWETAHILPPPFLGQR
jgi:hypothetical protein